MPSFVMWSGERKGVRQSGSEGANVSKECGIVFLGDEASQVVSQSNEWVGYIESEMS